MASATTSVLPSRPVLSCSTTSGPVVVLAQASSGSVMRPVVIPNGFGARLARTENTALGYAWMVRSPMTLGKSLMAALSCPLVNPVSLAAVDRHRRAGFGGVRREAGDQRGRDVRS
jgi:hypothetical protein